MGACDRDFGLVWPCAAEVAYSARGQGSRLGVDEEFRNRAFAEPAGIIPGDRAHVGRGACDRHLARPRQGRWTGLAGGGRWEGHKSGLQSLMRIPSSAFVLKKQK